MAKRKAKPDDGQITQFAVIFAGGTLISRMFGLIRDIVMIAFLPVGSREAFLVAFRFPNMLRDIVGEGAANAAFVPVFSKTLETKSEEEFQRVVSSAMGAMLIVLFLLSVAGMLLVPQMLQGVNALQVITGGKQYSAAELSLLSSLSLWTFPYLFFIGVAVFSMAVCFTVRHYSTPSWAPALLNVAMIGSFFFFTRMTNMFEEPAYALVVGVWVGGVAQVAVQYWAMGRYSGVWKPDFHFFRAETWAIFALLGPVVIGQAAGEVNKVVDSLFAYKSAAGSVTALTTANRLVQLPLAVFGFATAAAVLPAASRAAARNDGKEVRALIMLGMRQTFFMVAPAAAGLIVLGTPIVRLLFEYRHFTPDDTARTAVALTLYSIGLIGFAWVKVLVSGFFARHDSKTPVIVASGSMILNIILNVALVRPYGYKGLAFATTVSYFVNFAVLYVLLSQHYGRIWDRSFFSSMLRISLATAVMAAAAYGINLRIGSIVPATAWHADALSALIPILAAGIVYLVASRLFGVEELSGFLQSFLGRFRARR